MIAVAVLLGACGGDEETRTVVETVTTTVAAPPTTPPDDTGTPTETAATPLPSGVVTAEGTYTMKLKESDYEGENTTVDDEFPRESQWTFTTQCTGSDCTVQMRRELDSGAFKTLTLEPSDRPNVLEATSTGKTGCASKEEPADTRQRYSVKLNSPEDVDGRQTARKLDVYFTETTNACTVKPARGIVSWRGTLER